jgi:hypothetical protein
MRARLNENAQEAIQFLMLGAGLVLLIRLAYLGALRWSMAGATDPLHLAMSEYQNGYLLSDPGSMVVYGMPIGGRLALALLLALMAGTAFAVIGSILAGALGMDKIRLAVQGARTGLVLAGAWGLYAALTLPPGLATIGTEGVVLRDRPAFLGELSWPLSAAEQTIAWEAITSIEARSVASSSNGCGTEERVVLVTGDALIPIASIVPEGRSCNEAMHAARTSAEHLASTLRSTFQR